MILDWLPLISGVFSLFLGAVVLLNGASTRSKWPFVLFASSVGVWSILIALFHLVTVEVVAQVVVSTYYVAALLISYSLLIFSMSYVKVQLSRIVATLALLPWVVLSVIITIPGLFIESVDAVGKNVDFVFAAYVVYAAMFALYVLIGMVIMASRALRSRGRHDQRILVAALTICLLGGAYFNLFLPLIGNYSLISIGPLFTFIMVAAVFYAIARHGLFDIRLAVIRTTAYILSLSTLAGVYLLFAFVIFNQLLGQTSSVNQTIINLVLTLLLAFLFQPLKRFFDKWTNKLFYKDGYDVDDFYSKLNRTLASATDLRTLIERTARLLADTFKSEQVLIVVYTTGGRLTSGGTKGHSRIAKQDLEGLASLGNDILMTDDAINQSTRRLLSSYRIKLAMPLVREKDVVGYVFLGDHKVSSYSYRDLRVLKTIANELIIAIQNALSVQEVKSLNAHLEQRIDEATRELRRSNAQLQRLDEAKDEFISMASHQLRTPLTSIKGYISMLSDGDAGKVSNEQKHLLNEALISSERMVRLIGDFLNVSRLQTGKFIIEKQPTDLARVVEEEIETLTPNAAARGLKFVYKKPRSFPKLQLDESKIRQVVMNFADNAIYYSKEGGTITISLKADKKNITYTVKDKGIGVPLEEQEHLFHKFFRATNARKQRPDGTGVGLFLAKRVIDSHHGELIFESKEGRGSTFGFSLPIAKLRVRDSK